MSDCKISVIIPVYNGELFLRQCLDRVLQQSLIDFEIILINDASTDATQNIIDDYAQRDKRIHVIRQAVNKGVSAARNAGIEVAVGIYLTFLDADDYWMDDDMLASLFCQAETSLADIVDFGFIRSSENDEQRSSQAANSKFTNLQHDNKWSIRYTACAKLINLAYLKQQRILFDVSLVMGEDALFSTAMYCTAHRLVVTEAEYYCYRINPNSVNRTPWNRRKLHDALNWFTHVIKLITESEINQRMPNLIQTILAERMSMLYNKLGPLSLDILNEEELRQYIDAWSSNLQHLDSGYFSPESNRQQIASQQELYRLLMARDITAFKTFFKSSAYQSQKNQAKSVTILQQQAKQLGYDILQINKVKIRCNFGSGVIITLPKQKAHQLAKQLIANQNPSITLWFD